MLVEGRANNGRTKPLESDQGFSSVTVNELFGISPNSLPTTFPFIFRSPATLKPARRLKVIGESVAGTISKLPELIPTLLAVATVIIWAPNALTIASWNIAAVTFPAASGLTKRLQSNLILFTSDRMVMVRVKTCSPSVF